MHIAEEEDIQAQNEVNVQMKRETQLSRGRKQGTELARRRCGTCGKPGYNSSTCQTVITMSDNNNFN